MLREGGPSPTPSIAKPASAHRRRDSDHSMRSILSGDGSKYPSAIPAERNVSMNSRHSNQTVTPGRDTSSASSSTTTLNGSGGVYKDNTHSSSSITLPETIQEEFIMERPKDPAEIERLFQKVMAALDFAGNDSKKASSSSHRRNSSSPSGVSTFQNVQAMSLEKKWMIVESDARSQRASTRRQQETPPKFYATQMMNNKLTNSQLRDLEIMLRTSKVQ